MKFPGILAGAALLLGLAAEASAQATFVPQARQRIETINGVQKKLTSRLVAVKKVLVAQFFFSYDHASARDEVVRIFNLIAASDSIQFTFVTNVNNFTAPTTRQQYAVLVADNITNMGTGSGINATRRLGIRNYVQEAGGGILMLHGSGDTRSANWPWYVDSLHPSIYATEAVIGQVARVFQPATPASLNTALSAGTAPHPIMESISKDTTMAEEYHVFTNLISDEVPSVQVLLTVDNASYTCNCTASRPHPVMWTHRMGAGTMVYAGPGHSTLATTSWGRPNPTDIRGPYWQRFLRQSLYWAAGYDTTNVTAIKGDPSRYHFTRGGIAFHERDMSVVFTEPGRHSVQVLDMQGKILRSESGTGSKEYRYDPARFGRGVFVLRAITGGTVQSRRYASAR